MYRIGMLILFVVFQVNCTSSPVSLEFEEDNQEKNAKNNYPVCTTNNQSEECALLLANITYNLPGEECQVFDLLVEIDTEFFAPAGLGNGSTTRLDWEFLPNGNAGFWIAPIEEIIPANSNGVIEMVGCFTYGNQQTLRISRTIEDEYENASNVLTIEIDNPNPGKILANASSNFEVQSTFTNPVF